MEKDTVEVVLNPVARFVPGANGAVDLYVAPAYDDIASLYLEGDHWVVHYGEPARPDGDGKRVSKSSPGLTPNRRSARSSTEWPPMAERQAFIDRVKGAERESYVVAAAVNHYGQAVLAGDAQLPDEDIAPRPRHGGRKG